MRNFIVLMCALDFIEMNLRGQITVSDVAKASFTSTSHLQSMFSRTFNASIGDYVIKRKLCLAAGDLISGSQSITEVAFEFGYSNAESFTRAFKKQFLCTPSYYRKMYRFSELYPPINLTKEGFNVNKKYDLTQISEQILSSKGTYVICIDIDEMMKINDKLGFAAGDAAIAESAARIERSIKVGTAYYRIGADDFVILTGSSNIQCAEKIAQKIIEQAENDVVWGGNPFKFSLSIGITEIPEEMSNAKEILEKAQKAMILAKRSGKNCYKVN